MYKYAQDEHLGPFNLGNPGEFTMLELAQIVQELVNPKSEIVFRPNTSDDPGRRKVWRGETGIF